MEDVDLQIYLYILWNILEMLAKSAISISFEPCENITDVYTTSNHI